MTFYYNSLFFALHVVQKTPVDILFFISLIDCWQSRSLAHHFVHSVSIGLPFLLLFFLLEKVLVRREHRVDRSLHPDRLERAKDHYYDPDVVQHGIVHMYMCSVVFHNNRSD
jgi:hypothetical protein